MSGEQINYETLAVIELAEAFSYLPPETKITICFETLNGYIGYRNANDKSLDAPMLEANCEIPLGTYSAYGDNFDRLADCYNSLLGYLDSEDEYDQDDQESIARMILSSTNWFKPTEFSTYLRKNIIEAVKRSDQAAAEGVSGSTAEGVSGSAAEGVSAGVGYLSNFSNSLQEEVTALLVPDPYHNPPPAPAREEPAVAEETLDDLLGKYEGQPDKLEKHIDSKYRLDKGFPQKTPLSLRVAYDFSGFLDYELRNKVAHALYKLKTIGRDLSEEEESETISYFTKLCYAKFKISDQFDSEALPNLDRLCRFTLIKTLEELLRSQPEAGDGLSAGKRLLAGELGLSAPVTAYHAELVLRLQKASEKPGSPLAHSEAIVKKLKEGIELHLPETKDGCKVKTEVHKLIEMLPTHCSLSRAHKALAKALSCQLQGLEAPLLQGLRRYLRAEFGLNKHLENIKEPKSVASTATLMRHHSESSPLGNKVPESHSPTA